jgi:sialate O-acetylesterase
MSVLSRTCSIPLRRLRSFLPATPVLALLLPLPVSTVLAAADLRLAPPFSDHMVLQRETPLPVWGDAAPGANVTVHVAGQEASATADPSGHWRVTLPSLPASREPVAFRVRSAGGQSIEVRDALVGEVWFCSGQSNMADPLQRSTTFAEAKVQAAQLGALRHFQTAVAAAQEPQRFCGGEWAVAGPNTIRMWSAVAFYFGAELQARLQVPVGVINSSVGATRIESWLAEAACAAEPSVGAGILKGRAERFARWQQAQAAGRPSINPFTQKPEPDPATTKDTPCSLYNAMVAPHEGFPIRGFLWYQGEANRGDFMRYHAKLKLLAQSWRRGWGAGDLPFLFAQIAPFRYAGSTEPSPELWEAQELAARVIPNAGMVVTLDVGDLADIHPPNKKPTGLRLAHLALARAYGDKGVQAESPRFEAATVEGSRMRVRFRDTYGAMKTRDGRAPTWFEIAGADGHFLPADATIDGESVVVSSPQVNAPTTVRFAWHNEAQPNLVNAADLPAAAFRSNRPPPP